MEKPDAEVGHNKQLLPTSCLSFPIKSVSLSHRNPLTPKLMRYPSLNRSQRENKRTGEVTYHKQYSITSWSTRKSKGSMLIGPPVWTLDDRKSFTSHTRRDFQRGHLPGPVWQHFSSHGSPVQYRDDLSAHIRTDKDRKSTTLFRRTPLASS